MTEIPRLVVLKSNGEIIKASARKDVIELGDKAFEKWKESIKSNVDWYEIEEICVFKIMFYCFFQKNMFNVYMSINYINKYKIILKMNNIFMYNNLKWIFNLFFI